MRRSLRACGHVQKRRGQWKHCWWNESKGSRIRDGVSQSLKNHFSGSGAMARKIDILRRVTGGANGLGEQNRSLITEEM